MRADIHREQALVHTIQGYAVPVGVAAGREDLHLIAVRTNATRFLDTGRCKCPARSNGGNSGDAHTCRFFKKNRRKVSYSPEVFNSGDTSMRIILADDHRLFRESLRVVLETVPDY